MATISSAPLAPEMEQLTSGASNRIIPITRFLQCTLIFVYTFLFSFLLLLHPHRRRCVSPWKLRKIEEEDTVRRRPLAEGLNVVLDDGVGLFRSETFLFYGVRRNALICRSWFLVSGEINGCYAHFAKQLTSQKFGVFAMDWIGHGGSDGLHGYVPSLDNVVADTAAFLEKIKTENHGVPCFLFGHSTGEAVVLKASSYPRAKEMLEGIILTSPALRVMCISDLQSSSDLRFMMADDLEQPVGGNPLVATETAPVFDISSEVHSFYPIYLHASDNPGQSIVSVKLIGQENYCK